MACAYATPHGRDRIEVRVPSTGWSKRCRGGVQNDRATGALHLQAHPLPSTQGRDEIARPSSSIPRENACCSDAACALESPSRRGWRAVESASLENWCTLVVPRVQIPPPPPHACARWGASGPLRSKTRSRGAERCSEGVGGRVRPRESGDEGRALYGARR
jgi:hypothetical protein